MEYNAHCLMIQATMTNGQKGMVYPTTLRFALDARGIAQGVADRYNTTFAERGTVYRVVEVRNGNVVREVAA